MKTLKKNIVWLLKNKRSGRTMIRFLYFIKNGVRLKDCKTMSVLEYCKKNSIKINYIENEKTREVIVHPALNGLCNSIPKKGKIPVYPVYVIELKNAIITGGNDGIIMNDYVLNDRIDYIRKNAFGPKPSYCFSVDNARENILIKRLEGEKIEKGLCVIGRFPENWWHITFELLSKIQLFDMDSKYLDWPILIDDAAIKDRNSFKLLECLNLKKHPLIVLKKDESIMVRNMVYASCMVTEILGNYTDKHSRDKLPYKTYLFNNKLSINYIRSCVLRTINYNPQRKIFIARAKKGRLLNEKEVAEFFENHGFEILYSDHLTFEEEVEAFSNAKILISTMGGAMTNLVYASPKAVVVCIFPHKAVATMSMYQEIAHIVGFKFFNQDAEIVKEPSTWDALEYKISLENCKQLVENLNIKSER